MNDRDLFIDARYSDKSGLYRVATKTVFSLLDILLNVSSHALTYQPKKIIVLTSCPEYFQALRDNFSDPILHLIFSRHNAISLKGALRIYPYFRCVYLHFHSVPLFLSIFSGSRILYIHDALPFHNPWTPTLKLLKVFLFFYCRLPRTHIVSPSLTALDDVKKVFSLKPSKIHCIYNGIDLDYSNLSCSSANSSPPLFVSIGNIKKHKNLELSIQAFEKFSEFYCSTYNSKPTYFIIGKIYDKSYFKKLSSLAPSNVKFTGPLSDTDIQKLLPSVSALLFPSLHEGFGLPIAEFLNLKIPVVCLRLPVFEEIYGDFPSYSGNSIDDFYNRIRLVCFSSKYKDDSFWESALLHLSDYTWDNSASNLLDLIYLCTSAKP